MSGLFGKKQGEELVIGIEGMSCTHCVGKVNKGLEEMEGVFSVEVDLQGKKAVVRYDPDKEEIIGDEEANRLVHQPMRAPWRV